MRGGLGLAVCGLALALVLPAGRVAAQDTSSITDLQKAADGGDATAQLQLGDAYFDGSGVDEDHAMAAQWYLKAAAQGNADAETDLGAMYDQGDGVARDDAESLMWNRKAADQGQVRAQYNMGVAYDNGLGVAQDTAQAATWYRMAADQGYDEAEFSISATCMKTATAWRRTMPRR
ncbi:MAG: tetratricopeptide repeat protein [Asticcacaulis sp.]